MVLAALFALSGIAVALTESRRHTAERELTERIARLETQLQWTDSEAGKLAARIDDLESATRQDPHRKWWQR